MEGSTLESGNSSRKPMRRRLRTKKVDKNYVINTTEARREVAHALHIHRSSSTKRESPTSLETVVDGSSSDIDIYNPFVVSNSHQYQYCYSLMDTLPTPEPVWSTTTTTTAVLTAPAAASMEVPEFEWGENDEDASYSWWLGFLKTLDHSNGNGHGTASPSVSAETEEMRINPNYPRGFWGQCGANVGKLGDEPCLTESSDQLSSFADEWLMFPAAEDQGTYDENFGQISL